MVYVTVKGFPSNVWNVNAEPAKSNEPVFRGRPVNCFINDIATFPLPNGAFSGSPYF